MLMMLALSGSHAQQGLTDAHDARLVVPLTPSKGPSDTDDVRLVAFSRPARGQLMLMMLALSGSHAQQGLTDAHDARLVVPLTPSPAKVS